MTPAPKLFICFAFSLCTSWAGEDRDRSSSTDLLTGKGFAIGNAIYLQVNYQAAFGSSTVDPASLAVGHHDPDRHGLTQQDIEFSMAVRFSKHLSAIGTYAAKVDLDDHIDGAFEEYYLHLVKLPWKAEMKGGFFYPRFGYHQELHPHDFEFVDQFLTLGRFMGEDAIALYGAQIRMPVLRRLPVGWDDSLYLAYGAVPSEEGHEEHAHEAESHTDGLDAHAATFRDRALTADYTVGFAPSASWRMEGGASFAAGPNELGGHTRI
jgi:hypothetical protein